MVPVVTSVDSLFQAAWLTNGAIAQLVFVVLQVIVNGLRLIAQEWKDSKHVKKKKKKSQQKRIPYNTLCCKNCRFYIKDDELRRGGGCTYWSNYKDIMSYCEEFEEA